MKVVAFCDVDEKKITKGYYVYEETQVSNVLNTAYMALGDPCVRPFKISVVQGPLL